MWLRDYHVDGLRLDAVHAFADGTAVHILEQLTSHVRALAARLNRDLILIAESDANDPRLASSLEGGGYGLDAQWNDDFHHSLHAAITGERQGYYCDFGSMAGPLDVCLLPRRDLVVVPRPLARAPGGRPAHARPPLHRLPPESRSGR
jgi:1,4-alpha-glucan branching enzyme